MDEKKEALHQEIARAKIKIILSSICEAILLILELYIMINYKDSFVIMVFGVLFMIVGLFFLISGILEVTMHTKEVEQQRYEDIYNAQKASYLVIRKSFDEMDERLRIIEQNSQLPAEEIITAQKAVAKVTISRSKENTDALMNSNDELINHLSNIQEKLDGNNTEIIEKQQMMLEATKKDLQKRIVALTKQVASIEGRIANGAPISASPVVTDFGLEDNQEDLDMDIQEDEDISLEDVSIEPIEEEPNQDIALGDDAPLDIDTPIEENEDLGLDIDIPVENDVELNIDAPVEEEISLESEEQQAEDELNLESEEPVEEELNLESEEQVEEELNLESEEPVEEELNLESEEPVEEELNLESEEPIEEELNLESEPVADETIELESDAPNEEDISLESSESAEEEIKVEEAVEESVEETSAEPEPEPEEPAAAPEPIPIPDVGIDLSDPNRVMSPEEIEKLFASI